MKSFIHKQHSFIENIKTFIQRGRIVGQLGLISFSVSFSICTLSSLCLPFCLCISLPLYFSLSLSTSVSVYLCHSTFLSLFFCLSFYLCNSLYESICFCTSPYLPLYLSASVPLSFCLSTFLPLYFCTCDTLLFCLTTVQESNFLPLYLSSVLQSKTRSVTIIKRQSPVILPIRFC